MFAAGVEHLGRAWSPKALHREIAAMALASGGHSLNF